MTTRSPPTPAAERRVVVIDDDDVMLLSCRAILERVGYAVETFDNGEEGLARLASAPPPLLVVDLKMPRIDGLEVIQRTRKIDADVVIVVITGYATIATAVEAMKAGAYDFLPKPFTPDELRLIIDRGFERYRLGQEAARLMREKAEVHRRFATFVSHQLKTPLVAVKQYLDVLLYTSSDELPERAAEWIHRSQTRLGEMLALIHDWLDLARVERGELCLPEATVDLNGIVAQASAALLGVAEGAGVQVRLVVPSAAAPVSGDGASLTMVVDNLLTNAIKYNRRGGSVCVSVAVEGGMTRLVVADDGIGIAASAIPALFTEFHRVKTEATRDIPGTGLGLAICQRVVTELGGTITVESEEGRGTTFTVHLRSADSPPSRECSAPAAHRPTRSHE